jgi:hypothetical protein
LADVKAGTATTVVTHQLTKDYGEARVVDNLDLKLRPVRSSVSWGLTAPGKRPPS